MKLTLFTANCTEDPKNTLYPNKAVIASESDMKKAIKTDHVCACFKNSRRSNSNFISADNIALDCDNSHSDNPDDWITPEKLDTILSDVPYVIVFSRNHMKTKGKESARPRFHIFLPSSIFTDAEEYKALKTKVQQNFPFFDDNALDAARFFYGSSGEVIWHEGSLSIEAYLMLVERRRRIPAGQRNATLSRYAGKIVKRLGDTDEAHAQFLQKAAECEPPLDDDELNTIWNSALKFGRQIAKQDGYIPPDQYTGGAMKMLPDDFSDIGEARTFVDMFGDDVCYTSATDYLRYNGTYWEESEQRAVAAMTEHTDAQLAEADTAIAAALEKLEQLGVSKDAARRGGKSFCDGLDDAQRSAYNTFTTAQAYRAFVMKYRNMRSLRSALDVAKSMIEKSPEELDRDPFLLNTPGGTFDLRKGMDGWDVTDPSDYLTKVTAVFPDNEGADIWQDAIQTFFCGDQELIEYVQLICGLCLIGKVFVESLIIAYGSGRNGKSTFWNVIFKVLGSYSGNMSADALTANCRRNVKPELAELKGKRLIIAAELEEGTRLNTSIVKQLCSTDPIFAEKKFKAPFTFEPSHTIVLYTNHLPKVGASDDGTWRRLIVIPFQAKISDKDDRKNYTQYLLDNAGGAVLAWMIEGARKAIAADYKVKPPKCVEEAIGMYREDNNWFQNFLNECCDVDKTYYEHSGELYKTYQAYCRGNGEFPKSTTDFYGALEQAGFQRKRTNKDRFILGLRLKIEDFLN